MPYQNSDDGLYILRQDSEKNGMSTHDYGLIDVGNLLEHSKSDGSHPIIIHQTPPSNKS